MAGRRREPIERLHSTAELVQDEIVDRANNALRSEIAKPRPADTVQLWHVARGGVARLCEDIAKAMIRTGTADGSTERQFQIAQGLLDTRRRRQYRTIFFALYGHKGRGRPVHPIKEFRFPNLADISLRIAERGPFIEVVTVRSWLGAVAAAVVARTNPVLVPIPAVEQTAPPAVAAAEYRSTAWTGEHPDSGLAGPPYDPRNHPDYGTAMGVLDGLYPEATLRHLRGADPNGPTDDPAES